MGRILFIRVAAETFSEQDMEKAWPRLCALAWPDAGKAGSLAPLAGALVGAPGKGVMQLAQAIAEGCPLLEEPVRSALEPFATQLGSLRAEMEEALGDRDVRRAHTLSFAIEDALDEAEKAVSGLVNA